MTDVPPTTEETSDATSPGEPSGDERNMAMLCHILAIFLLVPLIIWLIKKDASSYVDREGKEALNWSITLVILWLAFGVVALLPIIQLVTCILYPALLAVAIVFAIISGIAASKGTGYRYPFALRLVK